MSPSPFIVEWAERIARDLDAARTRPRAFDVACGRGRHLAVIARAGFRTFGVDVKLDALRDAADATARDRVTARLWCADLTQHPLPHARFDLVIVTRYLQRNLFPSLQQAVRAGGVLLYETFTTAQRALGTGPTSPDHLLEPNELRERFGDDWRVLFYEERREPEAVARLAARRRSRS
jgi:tellurite methyltransferase